jgi:hypothetical protein
MKNLTKISLLLPLFFINLIYAECEEVNVNGTNYTVSSSSSGISVEESPYGLGCTESDEFIEGLVGLIVVGGIYYALTDGEESEGDMFSSYSSPEEIGLQLNLLPKNYFLKLTANKNYSGSSMENFNGMNSEIFQASNTMKLSFGYNIN